jgi:hypothetical protein
MKATSRLIVIIRNTLHAPFSFSDVVVTRMNASEEYILINSDLLVQETGLDKVVIPVGDEETLSLPFTIDYDDMNIWKIQVGRYYVVQRIEVPSPPPPPPPQPTQVRIDSLTWDVSNNVVVVVVRNTGTVSATIESIALRSSSTGSTYYSETFTTGNVIQVGQTTSFAWDETAASATGLLAVSTEYVIRVSTSTGFHYEMTATSPSS